MLTAAAMLLAGLPVALIGAPAQADSSSTVYDVPSETAYEYVVPDDVHVLHVTATGGAGAAALDAPGGTGAVVEADLQVTPGQTIYVHVGGDGDPEGLAGGINGGGDGAPNYGLGGGGASDVRMAGDGLLDRVLVAAGGGGAGSTYGQGLPRSFGGDADQRADGNRSVCPDSSIDGDAAQPGTDTAGGAGGVCRGRTGSTAPW